MRKQTGKSKQARSSSFIRSRFDENDFLKYRVTISVARYGKDVLWKNVVEAFMKKDMMGLLVGANKEALK